MKKLLFVLLALTISSHVLAEPPSELDIRCSGLAKDAERMMTLRQEQKSLQETLDRVPAKSQLQKVLVMIVYDQYPIYSDAVSRSRIIDAFRDLVHLQCMLGKL